MLYLNLKQVFQKRGITKPLPVMVKGGFTYHAAKSLLNPGITRIYFDHLEKLCIILNCSIEDLFAWSKPDNSTLPLTHPLHKLIPTETHTPVIDELRKLPLNKLAEVSKFLEQLQ